MKLTDKGRDPDHFPGQSLLEFDLIEGANAPLSDHRCRRHPGHIVRFTDERCPAIAVGRKQDLIILEVGRFEQDPNTVGQLPFMEAQFFNRLFGNDGCRCGYLRYQRLSGYGVVVGINCRRIHGIECCQK
ncbi:hypothetical protein ES703_01482 [subsurface metagenome]